MSSNETTSAKDAAPSQEILTRRAFNAAAPIAQLPPELLAEIFLLRVPKTAAQMRDISWFKVSHVCRTWRETALAFPAFWATPITRSRPLTKMMVARAGATPLVLRSDESPRRASAFLRTYPTRIGAIDVEEQQLMIKYILDRSGMVRAAAPHLRAVKIVKRYPCPGDDNGIGTWLEADLLCRAEVLAQGGAPLRTRLHLECCAFPWQSAWYSQLAHLHLQRLSGAYSLSLEELFSILLRSRNLETLALIDVGLHGPPGAPLVLTQLRALRLRAPHTSCTQLMTQLTLPAIARLDIEVPGNPDSDADADSRDVLPQQSALLVTCLQHPRILGAQDRLNVDVVDKWDIVASWSRGDE
ncbi:hypothetical protein B0H15DRAFT_462966 [Mycena belliarum]|uniref:F-box domain-containing protein n=1 Tax=Mycena belliarum TaxID=1033014 RepID=A0AAD6UJF9_9AGAR|nr:hypothetical protein B0H15DRAFT_462966 [Mycena belliae]